MKIFTINPHGDEVNDKVTITRGVQLSSFVLHDKPTRGIDLGYFQRDLDPANPVRKYFRVYMTHGSEFITDVKPYYVDGNFKSLTASQEDDDNTSACVFLNCDKPYGRARFFHEAEYGKKKILVNGKLVGEKEITARDGHTFRDECHPSILLVSKDAEYEISYFNTIKKCKQSAKIVFNGEDIEVTVSTIQFNKKKPTTERLSDDLLSSIREATYVFEDFKHDRKSRKNNKWDRNRKEDRWK